jgi:serine phosphatase RsbU (regulator of sigma subunit)
MATLITLQGPNVGRPFSLDPVRSIIGRRPDSTVFLESLAVSREHAFVHCEGGEYYVEDNGSSNGTFVNGRRITGRTPITEKDALQIGPYVFSLRPAANLRATATDPLIRTQLSAVPSNHTLYSQNPAHKLQVVLEIAQHLARTLDQDALLGKLLEHLFRLFPQADRGMVLLCEGDHLVVRSQRSRHQPQATDYPYSRTVVKKALDEGVGVLCEDVGGDMRFAATATVVSLKIASFLCVPLVGQNKRRLGVIQLDCTRPGTAFRSEDLELLTTVGLQVGVVLENVALYAEHVREARFRQELAMAREIQEGFLPVNFFPMGRRSGFELYAKVHPAREVSGDLYDFFPLGDGRLGFYVGDVSGKGMPAALFMVKVHTLARHLASANDAPSQTMARLNTALAANNFSALFVTMAYGSYDPRSGAVVLCSGGHPLPLLRRADGRVEEVDLPPGRLIGCVEGDPGLKDVALTLGPGETLALYTDGFVEARNPRQEMFETPRLRETLGGPRAALPLPGCAEEARLAVERFTGSTEQQDDLTLLLLRRSAT